MANKRCGYDVERLENDELVRLNQFLECDCYAVSTDDSSDL